MVQPICYAAILDAGSSGTRLYIFKWKQWVEGTSVPQIEEVYNKKRDPGISTLAADNNDALQKKVDDHLGPLFDCAVAFCTAAGVNSNSVPLFLLATAGMRDLQTENNERYLQLGPCIERCTNASKFDVKQHGTITGEAEALYGWIAANYSWGSFSGYGQRSSQAAGYVEMGGASAQIALPLYAGQPGQGALDVHQGRLVKVKIGPSEFDMFLASSQLGLNKAKKQYEDILVARGRRGHGGVILDPSKNYGWGLTPGTSFLDIPENNSPHRQKIEDIPARGTLDFDELKAFLEDIPAQPQPPARLPEHLQAALQNRTFLGGSNFWYNTREVFGRDGHTGQPKQTPFTFTEYQAEVHFVSTLDWSICKKRREGVKEKFLADACFTAEWIQRVLFYFFRFQDDAQTRFTPYNGNDGVELSWTLGKVILFALDSQPKEMDADVVRNVNEIRVRAMVRDDQARRMKVQAENAEVKWQQLQYTALTDNALIEARRAKIAARPNHPSADAADAVNFNIELASGVVLEAAAAVQRTWADSHDQAVALKTQAQDLWDEANAAETDGVNAIPVGERWF